MAAVPSQQLPPKSISTDPEGRVLKNQVSWAEEPCSPTISNTSTVTSSWLERLRNIVQPDPAPKYDYKLPTPCFIKILQVFVTVIMAGMYSEGIKEVRSSVTSMMFPYLVASNYLIVTPIILLSYVLGHRMPEILVRIFNILAVILFITAGAICMQSWHFHSIRYKADLKDFEELSSLEEPQEVEKMSQYLQQSYKSGLMLLGAGFFCFLNCMLYCADLAWSLYTSLSAM